jgi:hypothetical protein
VKVAVITDLHANRPALEAALAQIQALGVETIYCGGDLVGYGPHPNEVCALIDERRMPTIYGNYDYAIARGLDDCGCAYRDPREREIGQRSVDWRSRTRTRARNGSCTSCPSTCAWSSAARACGSCTARRGR